MRGHGFGVRFVAGVDGHFKWQSGLDFTEEAERLLSYQEEPHAKGLLLLRSPGKHAVAV